MHFVTETVRYIEQFAQIYLLICLWRRKLATRYVFFTAYMAAALLRECALDGLDVHSRLYAGAWAASQPILLVCQALAIIELFRFVLQHYPRTGKFSRLILGACFTLAAMFGSGMALWDIDAGSRIPWWLSLTFGFTRWVSWMSCGVLALQALWFSLFPIPMRPNIRHHRWLLAWYAGIGPGLMSIVAKLPIKIIDEANLCFVVSEVLCLIAWSVLLTPRGEICGRVPTISPKIMQLLEREFSGLGRVRSSAAPEGGSVPI